MAYYRPSGTGQYWHYALSWVTSSNGAVWVTASALPSISDDVIMGGSKLYVNARYTTEININSLSAQSSSIFGIGGGSLYISNLSDCQFKLYAPNGLYQQNGGSTVSLISLVGETGAGRIANATFYITGSLYAAHAPAFAAGPIISVNGIDSSNGTINILGNIYAATSSNSNTSAYLIDMSKMYQSTLNIQGNVSASYLSTRYTIYAPQTGSNINIVGNVFVPSASSAIYSTAPVTDITIIGNIICRHSGSAVLLTYNNNLVTNYVTVTGNITGSTAGAAISSPTGSDTQVLVYGNVCNSGSQMAIVASRIFVTASANLIIATGSATSATQSFFQQTDTTTYPATYDVYQGVSYGNSQTGTMTTPSSSHVRSGSLYSSGSTSLITTASGSCFIPSASHVRLGVLVDVAPSGGLMVVPVASQVSNSLAFDSNGTRVGTYSGSKDFWATSLSTINAMPATSIARQISQSLNTRAGSITGSMIDLLDTDTSNTITRLRSIASVADVGNALTQSANI